VTMAFLILSTIGLLIATWYRYIQPSLGA